MAKKLKKPEHLKDLRAMLQVALEIRSKGFHCNRHRCNKGCDFAYGVSRCVVELGFTVEYKGREYRAQYVDRFDQCGHLTTPQAIAETLHERFEEFGHKNELLGSPYESLLRFYCLDDARRTLPIDAPIICDAQLERHITHIKAFVFHRALEGSKLPNEIPDLNDSEERRRIEAEENPMD